MPKAVRINHSTNWSEIKKFQAHGHYNPSDDKTRPCCPGLLQSTVPCNTEPAPEEILDDSHNNVRSHVVGIVPAPGGQIGNVGKVEEDASHRPCSQDALSGRIVFIEPKDSDWAEVQTV